MDLQRISIKLYAQPESEVEARDFVPVFHSWIQNQRVANHLLIDVANYAHVPDGPGVVLAAHEASYLTDQSDGEFGLLYQRKQPQAGELPERVSASVQAVRSAAESLEEEDDLKAKVQFDRRRFRFIANDRLTAPNTEASFAALKPALSQAAAEFFGHDQFTLTRQGSDKERLSVLVKSIA